MDSIKNNKGFSLIELIVVIAIIGIISSLVIPSFKGYIEKSKEEVCNINCLELKKMYDAYLIMEGIDHSESVFYEFLKKYDKKICPEGGEITYLNGKVNCSIHSKKDESDSEDESIPFL